MPATPNQQLQGTWLAMVTLQTIGSVDMKHKLPAPKQFVAVGVLWGTLFLLADMGFGRLAARFSFLVLLIGAVLGPFGMRLVGFFQSIALRFGNTTASTSPTAAGAGTGRTSPAQPQTQLVSAPAPTATNVNV